MRTEWVWPGEVAQWIKTLATKPKSWPWELSGGKRELLLKLSSDLHVNAAVACVCSWHECVSAEAGANVTMTSVPGIAAHL